MESAIHSYPVDQETKMAFVKVCEGAGLSPKEVLSLFTHSVVSQGSIPTELKAMQSQPRRSDEPSLATKKHYSHDDLDSFESQCRFINELMEG